MPPRFEVSSSHTDTQTHPVGLLWASDQLVADAATYTTHNKHERRTSLLSAGLKPAIPAIERPQTYVLDRTATDIGDHNFTTLIIFGGEYKLQSRWLISFLCPVTSCLSETGFAVRHPHSMFFPTMGHSVCLYRSVMNQQVVEYVKRPSWIFNMSALCFGGLLVSHGFSQLVAEWVSLHRVFLDTNFPFFSKWWNTVTGVIM